MSTRTTGALPSLTIDGRKIVVRKAKTTPNLTAKTVLAEDPWDFVDLWMRQQGEDDARFYWGQAREFASAAEALTSISAPLPAYYSILNATKALLEVRSESYAFKHGIGGRTADDGRGLTAERVTLGPGGVLGGLRSVLGEAGPLERFNLKTLLYNLVWIHRAFVLTYTSVPELFIPLRDPRFVLLPHRRRVWLSADVSEKDASMARNSDLPAGWESCRQSRNRLVLRRKRRMKWPEDPDEKDLEKLLRYHRWIRKRVCYIRGPMRLWYFKRGVASKHQVDHSSMVITFAAMHRLSDLARYDPNTLQRYLEGQGNWLLNEFISIALNQFIDEIAAEITGMEFMIPGTRQ